MTSMPQKHPSAAIPGAACPLNLSGHVAAVLPAIGTLIYLKMKHMPMSVVHLGEKRQRQDAHWPHSILSVFLALRYVSRSC